MADINYNGNIIPSDQLVIHMDNRAFKYGDSLFETIRVFEGRTPFLSLHIDRLSRGIHVLGMGGNLPVPFWELEIQKLIPKGRNWRIRMMVFRKGGGLYTPQETGFEFIIEKTPLEHSHFILNEKGLEVGICREQILVGSSISSLKTGNSIPYILAAIHKKKNGWDDALLLNRKGDVAEAMSSNIFMIQGKKIITPPLASGCVGGTLRRYLLEQSPFNIKEKKITIKKLKEAEGIFLTNAIQGIQWVGKIEEKTFTCHPIIPQIQDHLNQIII